MSRANAAASDVMWLPQSYKAGISAALLHEVRYVPAHSGSFGARTANTLTSDLAIETVSQASIKIPLTAAFSSANFLA